MKNHLWFRIVWWLLCLPLEAVRVVAMMPVAAALYLTTLNLTAVSWVVLWLLVHFGFIIGFDPNAVLARLDPVTAIAIANVLNDFRVFFAVLFLLWLCGQWCHPLRGFIRFILTPVWRLGARRPPPKQMRASVAVKPTGSARETRQRMTARLSPELQRMIAGGG
jgi:hypothetical protein